MEIISYVGAASSSATPIRARKQKIKYKKLYKISSEAVSARFDVENSRKHRFIHAKKSKRLHAFNSASALWIFFTVCACLVVQYFVAEVFYYFQSFAGEVSLQTLRSDEVEILNGVMARFAMERSDDAIDEDGNVLADNGAILTASSVGLGIPVSFSTYKVKSGDTISSIAIKFGLGNISTLIAVNEINNVRTLRAGQILKIPNQDGITYSVFAGDSLNSLSVKFGVSVEEILDVNDLSERELTVGQELFIPGAKMDSVSLRRAMGELFMYPIESGWRLTSLFGKRADPFTGVASNHTGIDMACPTGTPIRAAMSGKVVYVGWSNIFGNYAIINHDGGYQTLYGHMSKTLCKSGQFVSQGTRIGLVGSTGYSTGPHLHFTVYKNGALVDPLTLLK